MSEDDRSIPVELVDFLTNNFSLIFLGLIVNKDMRSTFMETVSVEINLDKHDSDIE